MLEYAKIRIDQLSWSVRGIVRTFSHASLTILVGIRFYSRGYTTQIFLIVVEISTRAGRTLACGCFEMTWEFERIIEFVTERNIYKYVDYKFVKVTLYD